MAATAIGSKNATKEDLIKILKDRGFQGYSKMTRGELLDAVDRTKADANPYVLAIGSQNATKKDLIKILFERGVKGYSKMTRDELLDAVDKTKPDKQEFGKRPAPPKYRTEGLFKPGMGFGTYLNPYLNPMELKTLAATSKQARTAVQRTPPEWSEYADSLWGKKYETEITNEPRPQKFISTLGVPYSVAKQLSKHLESSTYFKVFVPDNKKFMIIYTKENPNDGFYFIPDTNEDVIDNFFDRVMPDPPDVYLDFDEDEEPDDDMIDEYEEHARANIGWGEQIKLSSNTLFKRYKDTKQDPKYREKKKVKREDGVVCRYCNDIMGEPEDTVLDEHCDSCDSAGEEYVYEPVAEEPMAKYNEEEFYKRFIGPKPPPVYEPSSPSSDASSPSSSEEDTFLVEPQAELRRQLFQGQGIPLKNFMYKDDFDINKVQSQYRANLEKRNRYRRDGLPAPAPAVRPAEPEGPPPRHILERYGLLPRRKEEYPDKKRGGRGFFDSVAPTPYGRPPGPYNRVNRDSVYVGEGMEGRPIIGGGRGEDRFQPFNHGMIGRAML